MGPRVQGRQQEAERAEEIVRQEVETYLQWERSLDAVPTIVDLREKVEDLRDAPRFRKLEAAKIKKALSPGAHVVALDERGREFIRRIAEATAVLGHDPGAARQIVENGRAYIQLLRAHIEREDTIVFPMVDQFLDEADQERLALKFTDFDRKEIESGRHETALRLLEDLTRNF